MFSEATLDVAPAGVTLQVGRRSLGTWRSCYEAVSGHSAGACRLAPYRPFLDTARPCIGSASSRCRCHGASLCLPKAYPAYDGTSNPRVLVFECFRHQVVSCKRTLP